MSELVLLVATPSYSWLLLYALYLELLDKLQKQICRTVGIYIKQLTEDADCQLEDLLRAMEDREHWKGRVNMVWAICPIR